MAHRGQPAGRRRGRSDAFHPGRGTALWLALAGFVLFVAGSVVLWQLGWTLLAGLAGVIALLSLGGGVLALTRGRGHDFDPH